MGDIGDGDPNDVATVVFGVIIRQRTDGIIMVTRIRRVDREKRQVAQIFAFAQSHRLGSICFCNHRIGEMIGDAVLVDGNQRHRFRCHGITQNISNPRGRQANTGLWPDTFRLYQFTILGVQTIRFCHLPFQR